MMYRAVIRDLADALAIVLPSTCVAGVLDATLCAAQDERLDEDRSELLELLHAALADARPEAVDLVTAGGTDDGALR